MSSSGQSFSFFDVLRLLTVLVGLDSRGCATVVPNSGLIASTFPRGSSVIVGSASSFAVRPRRGSSVAFLN